jgi:hypothetical protein
MFVKNFLKNVTSQLLFSKIRAKNKYFYVNALTKLNMCIYCTIKKILFFFVILHFIIRLTYMKIIYEFITSKLK